MTVTATDADGDTLTSSVSKAPSKGTLTRLTPTLYSFTYTPTAGARHAASSTTASSAIKHDTFAITVSDGYGGVTTIPVTVTISPKNAAPTAQAKVNRPALRTGVVTGTVAGADPDGDKLAYKLTVAPAKGSVSINATTGAFTYTPTSAALKNAAVPDAPSSTKADAFTVTVSDGHGGTANVSVKVAVTPPPSVKISGLATKYHGKTVGSGECVALVQAYLSKEYGVETNGNAVDYRKGGPAGNQIAASNKFEWHAGPDTNFQDGDIIVYKQGGYNTSQAGHIGIWYHGKLFDQNSGWHASYDPAAKGTRVAGYSPFWTNNNAPPYPNNGKIPVGYLGYWRAI